MCLCLPPSKAQWSRPESVHEDAKWQRGSTEKEGANGKAQIEHLFLLYAAEQILVSLSSNISNPCFIF